MMTAPQPFEIISPYHSTPIQYQFTNQKAFDKRTKYQKQLEFYALGKYHKIRYLSGGNRVGKTYAGSEETFFHSIRTYPSWWIGARMNHIDRMLDNYIIPLSYDAFVRNIFPKFLDLFGVDTISDFYKHDAIAKYKIVPQSDAFKYIELTTGARINIMSAELGKRVQGVAGDFVWIDEEFSSTWLQNELFMRTMNTDENERKLIITASPTQGKTAFIKNIERTKQPMILTSWDDVPHLTEQEKEAMAGIISPDELEARRNGVPSDGMGLIFSFDWPNVLIKGEQEKDILQNITSPRYIKFTSLDFGFNYPAVSYYIIDKMTKKKYMTQSFKFNNRGIEWVLDWMKQYVHIYGVNLIVDHAGNQRSQVDGKRLINDFVVPAGFRPILSVKGVDSNITNARNELKNETMFFLESTNEQFFDEIHEYKRDIKGRIVKEDDHIIDTWLYFLSTHKTSIAYKEQMPQY